MEKKGLSLMKQLRLHRLKELIPERSVDRSPLRSTDTGGPEWPEPKTKSKIAPRQMA
jgi:hypothetical protein